MTICDLVRNKQYVTSLTPVAPFIYTGYTERYTLPSAWGSSLDDTIFATGRKEKVLQVTRDFFNKYLQMDTYNECIAQEASFYFNKTDQQVFIHIEHSYSPIVSVVDYGYSFGICSSMSGTTYIDDYEYLPLIESIPDVEQEADVIGSSKPTGMTGSMVLNNISIPDPVTTIPRGELDFLLDESVFGNDVFVYDYDGTTLTPVVCLYIDDFDHSTEQVSFNLQDKRFA